MRKFGWLPDGPDQRDYRFSVARLVKYPPRVDLSHLMPPVWEQGELGSCTAQAAAAAHMYQQLVQHVDDVLSPSRLFLYYNARLIEGTTKYDAGATIRGAVKAVVRYGACDESKWPYNIIKYRVRPTKSSYIIGSAHQAIIYHRVDRSLLAMRGCIASNRPFIVGFSVYDSFMSQYVDATGVVPLPESTEQLLGGHAVLCVGYDDEDETFLCRNSWGQAWGNAGYFRIPYAYLTDPGLAGDFWTIALVE